MIHEIDKQTNKMTKLESYFRYLNEYNYNDITIGIQQIQEEFLEFLSIIKCKSPRLILEIGTADGGTLLLFTKVLQLDGTIISIDLSGNRFDRYPDWKIPLYESYKNNNQRIVIIRGSSHDKEIYYNITNLLSKIEKLDVLFIDGDHSYNGVLNDYNLYSKLVKKDGIIAFHDIVPGNISTVGGVPIFWNTIKREKRTYEIIKNKHQHGCGIGIIFND
jgi:cephalosporin hydroxylase